MPNRINSLLCALLFLCLGADWVFAQAPRPATGATRPPAKKSTIPAAGSEAAPRSGALPQTTREPAGRAVIEEEPAETAVPAKPPVRPQPQQAMQGPAVRPPGANGPAPKVVMQPTSEEMKALLMEWEEKTKGVTSLSCPMTRYEFDNIFANETRSIGTIFFQNPDKGRIDFEPADSDRMKKPAGREDSNGEPFKVIAGEKSRWICTGKTIYILNIANKSYDKIAIPPQMQGQNITNSPLPFIFGMKAKDAMNRYALRFGEFHNPEGVDQNGKPSRKKLHIVANPFDPEIAKEYIQADILLDAATFRPLNLRTKDPAGNKETVYSFDHKNLKEPVSWISSPFKDPVLFGWQLIQDIQQPPPRQAENTEK